MDKKLAVAYAMKRKNAKKMANGGKVNESAKTEQRPMPDERDKDAAMVGRNNHAKAAPPMLDPAPAAAAQRPSRVPLSRPAIVKGASFNSKLRDQEEDQMETMKPGNPGAQPKEMYDEEEIEHTADEPDMSKPHTTAKAYAEGGMVDEEEEIEHHASIAAAIMARQKFATGGFVDIEENAEEQPNEYYDRNEAVLKENYDSDMMDLEQPEDSNEHAVTLEDADMRGKSKVQRIMARMKKISPIVK